LYPDKHELKIFLTEEMHKVELTIQN